MVDRTRKPAAPLWTIEEESLLRSLVKDYSNNLKPVDWDLVGTKFPRRSSTAVRQHYTVLRASDQGYSPRASDQRYSEPNAKTKRLKAVAERQLADLEGWTETNLKKLLSLDKKTSGRTKWDVIAAEFPPFSPNRCYQACKAYKVQKEPRIAQQEPDNDNSQLSASAEKLESRKRIASSDQGRHRSAQITPRDRGTTLSGMSNPRDSEVGAVTSAMAPLTISVPSADSPWEPPRAGHYEWPHNRTGFQQPSAYTSGSSNKVSPYAPRHEAETAYPGISQTYGDPIRLPPDQLSLPSFRSTPAFMREQSPTASVDAYASWPQKGAPQPTSNPHYPRHQDHSRAPSHPHGDVAAKRNRSDSPKDPQKAEASKSTKKKRPSVPGEASGRSGEKGKGK